MAKKRVRDLNLNEDIILPNDETIFATSLTLLEKEKVNTEVSKYAPVRHVLAMVGSGKAVNAESLPQYNPYYVQRTLKRLIKQQCIVLDPDTKMPHLTTRGKRWVMKYTLEDLEIAKQPRWDGKWRMVIYDVGRAKASLRNVFRSTLRRLGFHCVQESVWIFPYPCEKEIVFLRNYCGMGSEVIYVIAHKIENDAAYRAHFSI